MRATTATYETFAGYRNTKTRTEALRFARNVALFALAPFVGLVYALAFPFVGMAALAWLAYRAVRERRPAE